MSPAPQSNVRPVASQGLTIDVPQESRAVLARFLSKRGTGNVQFNVKDGMILGAKIEAIFRQAPRDFGPSEG